MCQSADCQLFAANGVDKENFDVNNNSGTGGGLVQASTSCHCMANRRTRRRHPATVQTPGRLEVGEVILEPLVSNRLEGSIECVSDWNENVWKQNNSFFSNNHQPLKPYRFDVIEENLLGHSGNSNNSSSGPWKYNYMSSSTKMI